MEDEERVIGEEPIQFKKFCRFLDSFIVKKWRNFIWELGEEDFARISTAGVLTHLANYKELMSVVSKMNREHSHLSSRYFSYLLWHFTQAVGEVKIRKRKKKKSSELKRKDKEFIAWLKFYGWSEKVAKEYLYLYLENPEVRNKIGPVPVFPKGGKTNV